MAVRFCAGVQKFRLFWFSAWHVAVRFVQVRASVFAG